MEFQSGYERNLETIPVGELGIISLKSCEALGNKINAHIVEWRKEREHELIQSRNRRMGENNGFLWIDAASKVVNYHIANIVLDVLCGVAVGNNLIVGNDNSRGYAFVLQRNAFLDGAEIVAQVQTTRRTIARKHRVLAGVYLKVGADCLAALLACFKTIGAHNEQCLFRLIRNGD